MKVIAFTRLHYGLDYLEAVIGSTAGFAEQHVVLYTPLPTFGNSSERPCPDSRFDLYEAAQRAGGARLHWVEGAPISPQTVLDLHPDADLILELDADEVIHPALIADIVQRYQAGELVHFAYRLPFLHHWRSFRYACFDSGWPVRLYVPPLPHEEPVYWPGGRVAHIHHFGYARREPDMRYKIDVSMHKGEFRPGWWDDIFNRFPDRLHDLHPVCLDGFWNAEWVAHEDLPPVLWTHPYADLEVIA